MGLMDEKEAEAVRRAWALVVSLCDPNDPILPRWKATIEITEAEPWLIVSFEPVGPYTLGSIPTPSRRIFAIWRHSGGVYSYTPGQPIDDEAILPFDAPAPSIVSGDRTERN